MSAYFFVNVEVNDPETYETYKKGAKQSVERHGGKYIARGGRAETLEGDFTCHRVVLVEFPDYEAAKAWWDSEDYREFREMRQKAATSTLVLVEGA